MSEPDPFNCPACGRHDFGLLREDLVARSQGQKGMCMPVFAKCDRTECPLRSLEKELERVQESLTFLGVECRRTSQSEDGHITHFAGEIKRGEHPWVKVSIHRIETSVDGAPKTVHMVRVDGMVLSLDHQESGGLDAAEDVIRRQIGMMHRDLEVLGTAEPIANLSIAAALYRFGRDWEMLPPLVRAGLAHNLFTRAQQDATHETRGIYDARHQGLSRRSRVRHWFREAHLSFLDLFHALTREADAKAMELGIGYLDGGERHQNLLEHPDMSLIADPAVARNEIEALGDQISRDICAELDREALAALEAAKKGESR